MPFVTLDHVRAALDYFSENTHPALMSVLAMLRQNVPASDDDDDAVRFGSPDERKLLDDYFKPPGGPENRPYFLVFGTGYGYSHWRDRDYPGKTLQVFRRNIRDLFRKSAKDNKRWTLSADLVQAILDTPADKVVGAVPLRTAYLAVWCYRGEEIASLKAAVRRFEKEFRLLGYGLSPNVFVSGVPADLAAMPMADEPIDPGQLLVLLQEKEPDRAEVAPEDQGPAEPAPVLGPAAKVWLPAPPPGDWNLSLADLGDLCGLVGVEEAAVRALAALSANMHVVFTGPPGTGKTTLAACICARSGFPEWTVPATDQWTTFETIGGYFPMPDEASASDRLDFLPGAVVESLERGLCLIIDELNRADIDKAFGELFTLLSGNSVTLPFRRRSSDGRLRRVRLQVGAAVIEDEEADVIVVPSWWRIIGAMNDADKASLKRLSMAFVRRFAFVPVDLPPTEVYALLVRRGAANTGAALGGYGDMLWFADVLIQLFCGAGGGFASIGMPLGPSFPLTMLRQADSEWRVHPSRDRTAVLASSLELHVIAQLQGRPDLHDACLQMLRPLLGGRTGELGKHLAVWTGYIAE